MEDRETRVETRGKILTRLLACMLLVVVAAVSLIFAGDREPAYKGKRLSQWLSQYEQRPPQGMPLGFRGRWLSQFPFGLPPAVTPARLDAERAVRHLGNESLPWLLRWLAYEPPAWREKLTIFLAVRRMPFKNSIIRLVRVDDYRVWQGLAGFEILGSEAAPAVPDLARLLRVSSSRWWSRADAAALALEAVGRNGLPPLITALADPASRHRVETIAHLRSLNLGTNGWFAAPVLTKCVNDRDLEVAGAATWALTELGLPQETVLPAIKMAVLDPRWNVRYVAVQALGRLGKQALPCRALLTNCFNDPDPRVTEAATNALNRIAEDAPTNTDSEDLR